jgi:glycosyltransferase involved in cell wall biosynthesis
MKIVHIIGSLGVGGAEEMLVDIVNEQCRGCDVTILVLNDIIDAELRKRLDPRIPFFSFQRRPGSRNLWPLVRVNLLMNRIQPDIVHSHTSGLEKLFPFRRFKMVLTVHATRQPTPPRVLPYDRVFAISEAVADEVQQRTRMARPTVVNNGIPVDRIRRNKEANQGLFRIVQVARLDHNHKGQDLLIQAVARIRDRYPTMDISLDLIGDGESRGYLERMTSEFGVNKVVTFRGTLPRSQIYEELCRYDLLVQASRYEGFGLAVVEAMAAGVPVLVSDLEGPREIIEMGRLGFLFQPESVEDCARQIANVHDRRSSASLAQVLLAAREKALIKYNVKRTAEIYLAEYLEILSVLSAKTRVSADQTG